MNKYRILFLLKSVFFDGVKHCVRALSPFVTHRLLKIGGVGLRINGRELGPALCYSVNCSLHRCWFLPKFLAFYLHVSVFVRWVYKVSLNHYMNSCHR